MLLDPGGGGGVVVTPFRLRGSNDGGGRAVGRELELTKYISRQKVLRSGNPGTLESCVPPPLLSDVDKTPCERPHKTFRRLPVINKGQYIEVGN